MNVFMIRDGLPGNTAITENILEGITRRSIIELAREELHLTVIERTVDRTEVYLCDELFMTGTAVQVTAVTEVDHRPIGSGKMGPITGRLYTLYQDILRGRVPKYLHWLTPVYEKVEDPSTKEAFPSKVSAVIIG
jgi:branched-chain amino acid aminotransferase